jgi:aminoglycoside 3-N-acetyltransferase
LSSTSRLTKAELVNILASAGVRPGDVVHVQSDLLKIGPVEAPASREGILQFYLDALLEAVGSEGTLTTCTAFEDYGRYGTPFVREESPSRVGALSEFIRTRPGAVRSMHPLMSVTALGKQAEALCGGNHFDGFGYSSPWGRLHRANAKLLTLGMGANGGGTTFFHYVEKLYGVPYQYTKIYDAPVHSHGKIVQGPFTLSVRYLDFGIENTPVRVKTRMVQFGEAREFRTGACLSWCANAQTVVDRMMQMFDEDRWMMLERKPTFRPGEMPMDGFTGAMKFNVDKGGAHG